MFLYNFYIFCIITTIYTQKNETNINKNHLRISIIRNMQLTGANVISCIDCHKPHKNEINKANILQKIKNKNQCCQPLV